MKMFDSDKENLKINLPDHPEVSRYRPEVVRIKINNHKHLRYTDIGHIARAYMAVNKVEGEPNFSETTETGIVSFKVKLTPEEYEAALRKAELKHYTEVLEYCDIEILEASSPSNGAV